MRHGCEKFEEKCLGICYYLINSVLRLITALQFSSPQDWFAFIGNGSEFNFTLSGEAIFPNKKAPTAEDNYGFCQVRVLGSYQKY